jgi:hypothetical protein
VAQRLPDRGEIDPLARRAVLGIAAGRIRVGIGALLGGIAVGAGRIGVGIGALLGRIAVGALLGRIAVGALLGRIAVGALLGRIGIGIGALLSTRPALKAFGFAEVDASGLASSALSPRRPASLRVLPGASTASLRSASIFRSQEEQGEVLQ